MINTATKNSICAPKPKPRLSVWQQLHIMLSGAKQRRQLADLDNHLLSDIGVTRPQALKEAGKPLWDIPHYWKK